MEQTTRRPLEGIRVIDFSMFMAGPFCTRALADLGADVIKIEPPRGDNQRTLPPFRDGVSSYFGAVNAGKRSVVLDLKKPEQRDIALDLLKDADVAIENGRPGGMKSFGLEYETVSRLNPRLIYCSISGFGQEGPGSQRPAYAMTIHAACGIDMAHMSYQDGHDRPPNVGIFTADMLAGVYAITGVLTALYDRERTGCGQYVDLALMDCMLAMLPYEVQEAQFPSHKRRNTYKPLRTSDGFIMLALVTAKNFESVFEVIGRPEWSQSAKYGTTEGRGANWDDLFAEIEQWTAMRTSHECHSAFDHAGVPAAKYQSVKQALEDPQLKFRGTLSTVSDRAGSYQVVNQPFKLSNALTTATGRSPALGEHSAEILNGLECAGSLEAVRERIDQ